jgi:hypothetical protein
MQCARFGISATVALLAVIGVYVTPSSAGVILTGDPVADGYTYLGSLWDTGKWVADSGAGSNAKLYAKSFILGTGDTASSQWGDYGNTTAAPKNLVGLNSNWQAGDRIFSLGIVSLSGYSGNTTLTFKFNSDNSNGGASVPWKADSTGRSGPTSDGTSSGTSGTTPGDLRTWQLYNYSQGGAWNLLSGGVAVQFKDSLNADAVPGIPAAGEIGCNFFNGATSDLDRGETLINLSAIARWAADPANSTYGGVYKNPSTLAWESPDPFADVIDFVIQSATGSNKSEAVFFGVSTAVPEPATLSLLAMSALSLLRRRRAV